MMALNDIQLEIVRWAFVGSTIAGAITALIGACFISVILFDRVVTILAQIFCFVKAFPATTRQLKEHQRLFAQLQKDKERLDCFDKNTAQYVFTIRHISDSSLSGPARLSGRDVIDIARTAWLKRSPVIPEVDAP